MIGQPTSFRTSAAAMLMLGALAGCQASEPLVTRANPDRAGPFGHVGYRNLSPLPVPGTDLPNAQLSAFGDCVSGAESREAATWIRDWFASISTMDKCDDWAAGILSSPKVRQGLVYILEATTSSTSANDKCRAAAFQLFTKIEERHSRISSWRGELSAICTFAKRKQVVENREAAFTQRLAELARGLETYQKK